MAEWNSFWTRRDRADLKYEDPWESLVWRVGLEFWQDIYAQHVSGKTLLECGCGGARHSQYFAAKGYDCTMLDSADTAIDFAKKQFLENSLCGSFQVGDINKLPFQDNAFDIVYSGGVLHHFENITQPVCEMVRVLKPGGMLAATVIPRKLSCQSLANAEIRGAAIVKGLLKLDFGGAVKGAFRPMNEFYVNSLTMNEYLSVFKKFDLEPVCGFPGCPFPNLSLPRLLKKEYGRLMNANMRMWKRFNYSQSKMAQLWGVTYNIFGVKK